MGNFPCNGLATLLEDMHAQSGKEYALHKYRPVSPY